MSARCHRRPPDLEPWPGLELLEDRPVLVAEVRRVEVRDAAIHVGKLEAHRDRRAAKGLAELFGKLVPERGVQGRRVDDLDQLEGARILKHRSGPTALSPTRRHLCRCRHNPIICIRRAGGEEGWGPLE